MKKSSTVIRIGDKFKVGSSVYRVWDTKPGGIVELVDDDRKRSVSSYHRIVKTWERVLDI